ncbi:uncharacterized protein LOC135834190 [Planococcus citri]|uniref:uncharacterized protein LOC135834190 n=1 Tax=Planococcus citri TaxID=170843 RepID=UPI0031F73869
MQNDLLSKLFYTSLFSHGVHRYLSTGQSFHSLAFTFRMGISTVRQIVYSTCQEIWETFSEIHLSLPTKEDFLRIADEFYRTWQYPNCLGSIDGKHIRIKCPGKSGSLFFNYRKFFSIVLQGVADAKYRFVCVDIGAYGHQNDAGTFRQSMFYDTVFRRQECIPDPRPLPGTNTDAPFVFLGDKAYPLLPNLMRPFPKASLTPETKYYNDRHSSARKTIECTFGILAAKWRLLWKPIEVEPKHADNIVKCMCVLHNLIIDIDGPPQIDSGSRLSTSQTGRRNLHNSSDRIAQRIREMFKNYFLNNIVR